MFCSSNFDERKIKWTNPKPMRIRHTGFNLKFEIPTYCFQRWEICDRFSTPCEVDYTAQQTWIQCFKSEFGSFNSWLTELSLGSESWKIFLHQGEESHDACLQDLLRGAGKGSRLHHWKVQVSPVSILIIIIHPILNIITLSYSFCFCFFTSFNIPPGSVGDRWHFCADPDPRIHTSD